MFGHSVESKKKIAVLGFFVGLFLFVGSANADWWNDNYQYKMPLEVNQTGSTTLINFPIVVNGTFYIDTETLISAGKMNGTCKDIRFLNSDEDTELDFEFESHADATYGCDTTQTLVHLEVNSLPSTNTTLYMYYGNPTADFGNSTTGTWETDIKAVWHFGEGSETDTALDSTSNAHTLYALDDEVGQSESAKYGYGSSHQGTKQGWTVADSPDFDAGSEGFMIEMWALLNGTEGNDEWLIERWGGTEKQFVVLIERTVNDYRLILSSDGSAESSVCSIGGTPLNQWIYLAFGWNGTHAVWYTNGQYNTSCAYASVHNSSRNLTIGTLGLVTADHNAHWNGKIDEIKWHSKFRSADYIKRSYEQGLSYFKAEEEADIIPPTYSDNSTNSTLAGTPVEHRLNWTDETGLSGYIFSFDNCTSSLANDTWQSMTGLCNWSNVTKIINETVECTIQWCVYTNDTFDNWNGTSCDIPFNYTTTVPPVPLEICIQHFLEKGIYALLCNVTSISHNQNYCSDNVTLVHNITYTINETDGQFETSEYCNYGCNSESLKCNPEPFQVNLWIIAGIFGFLILVVILLKLLRLI